MTPDMFALLGVAAILFIIAVFLWVPRDGAESPRWLERFLTIGGMILIGIVLVRMFVGGH